jgi:hypothetical protein
MHIFRLHPLIQLWTRSAHFAVAFHVRWTKIEIFFDACLWGKMQICKSLTEIIHRGVWMRERARYCTQSSVGVCAWCLKIATMKYLWHMIINERSRTHSRRTTSRVPEKKFNIHFTFFPRWELQFLYRRNLAVFKLAPVLVDNVRMRKWCKILKIHDTWSPYQSKTHFNWSRETRWQKPSTETNLTTIWFFRLLVAENL